MENLFNKLLDYYDMTEEQYKVLFHDVTLNDVPDPFKFEGMEKSVAIAKEAIDKKKKIIVYGDYDCDGIMSTSIIVKTFLNYGIKIGYYVPSRYIDGYGITMERAKEFVEKGYELLITVDNGITAFEPIDYCKQHGMKVIIIDHHLPASTLPNADAIIHPQVSNFSKIATSAGFCSFMFSYALMGSVEKYLLILGAISIVSDMMPLIDFNRDMVRLATKIYYPGQYLAIDCLREIDTFNYLSIGMKIAPKINSVGRVIQTTGINRLIEFFTTDDRNTIAHTFGFIVQCNQYRRQLTKGVDITLTDEEAQKPGIVKVIDIQEGLIGILANRLLGTYGKPSVVLCEDSTDSTLLRGSCRASEGFNIVKCFDELGDLLVNSGGHAFAGGLTIKKKDLDKFTEKFNDICAKHPIVEAQRKAIEIELKDIGFDLYKTIDKFSPFGEEWNAPFFKINHIKTDSLNYSKDSKHIITFLGQSSRLIGFSISKEEMSKYDFIDVIGTVNYYYYHEYVTIQFQIDNYKKSTKN